MASTVETELAKAMSALPWSTALTLAMPPPGSTWTLVSGMFFCTMFWMAPPSGYHDPPCGPVIRRSDSADAAPAPPIAPAATPASISLRIIVIVFLPDSLLITDDD